MAKMKKNKQRHRNAAPVARAPSVPRVARAAVVEETPMRRLGYTAAGAAGTALVGSFLAREGWAPKTVAGLLTAAGGMAAWTSHDPTVRNVGAGAMSAASAQLALLMIDEHDKPAQSAAAKRANADGLPQGALESAFERARARMLASAE